MLPELLLFGEAGHGKDTVAEFLVQNHGAAALAMADPMKRLGARAFDFSEEQLWGPSQMRNAMDPRFIIKGVNEHVGFQQKYAVSPAWEQALAYIIGNPEAREWVAETLDVAKTSHEAVCGHSSLVAWVNRLAEISHEQGGLSARTMLQTLGTEWGRYIDDRMWIRYAQRAQRQLLSGGYSYSRLKGLVDVPGQKYQWAVVTDGRFRNECLEFRAVGQRVVKVLDPNGKSLQAGVKGHASESEQKTIPYHWYDFVLVNDKTNGLGGLQIRVDQLVDAMAGSTIQIGC